ncbi:hypothetical protein CRM22_010893 [Opisthorchis felineus]|uniref:Hexosyltransferase n=1 Tax=Opisthorchis felineus TaxID=147828 RepID=A0A4S2KPH3_OPIFE|nr:hypothetical protein CRM22_010893 [Opisthorchis felineus]
MQGKKILLSLRKGHNRIAAMWPLLSLCLVFVLCFSITQRPNSKPNDSYQSTTDNQMDLRGSNDTRKTTNYINTDPIHLFLVIRRLNVLNKAVTMLKSLLYYQGHFRSGMKTCELDWSVPSGILCENVNATPIAQPIMLHLIVHQKAWNKTFGRFQQWNSTRFLVKLYEFKNELALRGTEAERSPRVQLALQNLMAPYIVDQSVDKIIVLSPDLLFNENVAELWAHFEHFSSTQAVGAVCEQVDDCDQCCPKDDEQFPLYGLNTGLVLLHLDRLRKADWRGLYKAELSSNQYVQESPGDLNQGILNTVLSKRMRMLYRLPCEWNIQAHTHNGLSSCPVHWVNQKPAERLCPILMGATNMLRAVQYDVLKTVDLTVEENEESEQEIIQGRMRAMTSVYQLRAQFHQIYNKFQQLPMECFA